MRNSSNRFLLFLFALSLFASDLPADNSATASLAAVRSSLESGSKPVKIVCFGDSVTGVYYHTGGRRAYTDMVGIALKQIHPKADIEMVNAGISGNTTANALARIEKDVLRHKPDLVTVMFGLNDVAKSSIDLYRKNLLEIVDRCREAGSAVVLCTPNAVLPTEARPVEKLEKFCDVVRAVAREKGVPLSDCYSHCFEFGKKDRDAWTFTLSDEIHPNMAGHKIIAEQIAETITGEATSLSDVPPLPDSLGRTLSLLENGKPVRILAMPPFDKMIDQSLRSIYPEASLEIHPWPTEGMTLYQLRKDASHRVRKMKPDLVLVAVPRSATAADRAEFIHEQVWTTNYSLSFGLAEWDVVVIHPSVNAPLSNSTENDELVRSIPPAQDLNLIDRPTGDKRSASDILTDWIQSQVTAP